jgi:hypothetical protein
LRTCFFVKAFVKVDDVVENKTGREVILLRMTRRAELDGKLFLCIPLSCGTSDLNKIGDWIFVTAISHLRESVIAVATTTNSFAKWKASSGVGTCDNSHIGE